MANITSQKWLDLIFAGKNKDFGAYQLRKKSAKRHNLAVLFTFIGLVVIVGLVIGWSQYSAYRAEQARLEAEAERMRALAEMEKQMEQEMEEEVEEQKIEEQKPEEIPEVKEEVVETVQQTAIAIVDEVKNEARSMDEALEDKTIVDVKSQEGNTDDVDHVEIVKDLVQVAPEPVKEEPKPEVKEPEPEKKEEPKPEPEQIFQAVEQQAQFPGGQAALSKWLGNNLKYPESAQQNNVEGRVIVQFVVEKDGSISQAHVVKGVDKDLDKEALRVVGKMPKWQPGKNNGVVVRSIFTLPVVFKLQTL